MHEASLRACEIFPCCKQWHSQISFELIRRLRDEEVLPFSEGSLFKDVNVENWRKASQLKIRSQWLLQNSHPTQVARKDKYELRHFQLAAT
jgi:hypothetical protein